MPTIRAAFPIGRDLCLDLLRGLANWAIFLNHMPSNAVNWITTRHYGFSDGADLFVFISGYTAALVFGRMMRDHGFLVGATRLWKRVWQLYLAHVMVLVIYIAIIGYVASRLEFESLIHQFNVARLLESPFMTLAAALLLAYKPLNLDILPLYIFLMAPFPLVLWIMLRRPGLVMLASTILYVAARQAHWNVPAFPDGSWFFNPFCWQLMFCMGAWTATSGKALEPIVESPWTVYLGISYLLFAMIMTLAGHFPSLGELIPRAIYDQFNPNDKTNLAPYRALHFVVVGLLVIRLVPKDWKGFDWPVFDPLITCGRQSLRVFCVGLFLSFLGYFLLVVSSGTLLIQILISVTGLSLLCGFAYYGEWSKGVDELVKQPPRKTSITPGAVSTN